MINYKLTVKPSLRQLALLLLLIPALALVTGCSAPAKTMQDRLAGLQNPDLNEVIRRNIEATGGQSAWSEVRSIAGDGLATVRQSDSGQTLIDQKYRFGWGGNITILSSGPAGVLEEQLTRKGKVKLDLDDKKAQTAPVTPEQIQTAANKLRLIYQAVMQGPGMLSQDCNISYAGLERKEGRLDYKIELSGKMFQREEDDQLIGQDDLLVLWFDADSMLLERLWLRYRNLSKQNEFGYMSASLSNYQQTSGGLKLPMHIEIGPSDQYQQFIYPYNRAIELKDINVAKRSDEKALTTFIRDVFSH